MQLGGSGLLGEISVTSKKGSIVVLQTRAGQVSSNHPLWIILSSSSQTIAQSKLLGSLWSHIEIDDVVISLLDLKQCGSMMPLVTKVVQDSWLSQRTCSSPSDFAKKSRKVADSLSRKVADALSSWQKNHFGHVSTKIESLRRELKKKQVEAPSSVNLTQLRSIENELRALTPKEETMWKQRSRVIWPSNGDKNSSFFHCTATGWKKRNSINCIKNAEGQWVEQEVDIERAFLDYFHSEAADGIDEVLEALSPKVLADDNSKLCEAFTEEEVDEALNQMHPLRAPGPDGIPALFYSHFWSTIKHDLLSMVWTFLMMEPPPYPLIIPTLLSSPKS